MSPHTEPQKNRAEELHTGSPESRRGHDAWWWRHLPILLITTMLTIAIILEATVVPPLAWPVKLPLALMLVLYAWAPRLHKGRSH